MISVVILRNQLFLKVFLERVIGIDIRSTFKESWKNVDNFYDSLRNTYAKFPY